MPLPPKPQRTPPTEEWEQLELLFTSAEQRIYEQIRPVVLFGIPPRERAKAVGVPERTLYRQVERFTAQGMRSLFVAAPVPRRPHLPDAICAAVAALHAEYPALHLREIATICYVRFGRKLSHNTVKRILAEPPSRPTAARRYPPFHEMEPEARRTAIIRLHAEGWHPSSIAGYLQTSRQTVHTTLTQWVEQGVRGLPNMSHAPRHPRRKVTFTTITAVRRLGRNPGLGAWRVHAALLREGIRLSPRTCGRMFALNRALYHVPKPAPKRHEPKPMPFRARYRHQYWSVDIRYLDHKLGGGNNYAITILENYSRAVLASAISRTQALTAYLIVLFAAIRMHGSPEGLVSDGGSVFKAKQAQVVVALMDCHPTTQEFTGEDSPRRSQSGEQNATARARRGATLSYPAAHRRDL